MQISKMTIEDYSDVYKLWISTKGMGLNNIDDSQEGIQKYLQRNPDTCFVARENGEVIGVVISGHDGRRGFIYHTSVKISERNKGVGKKLVGRALDALRKEGISKVALVVFNSNETGNGFWEKLGFMKRNDLTYRDKVISEDEMIKINT